MISSFDTLCKVRNIELLKIAINNRLNFFIVLQISYNRAIFSSVETENNPKELNMASEIYEDAKPLR